MGGGGGGGVWAVRGDSGHAAVKDSLNTYKRVWNAGSGVGGGSGGVVWVVRARGGPGTPLAALKDLLNTYKRLLGAVWVVGAVRAPAKRAKNAGSGVRAGGVWAARARGGPGTHWQPLNTL